MSDQSLAQTGAPGANQWKLFTSAFFNGSVGGSGQVIGSQSWQHVTVLDLPGSIVFDTSFSRGNDCVTLPGNAAGWTVHQQVSLAVFSDGDTCVSIPVGTVGMTVGFDDGMRTLVCDTDGASMKIGGQAIGESAAQILAAVDGAKAPPGTMGGTAKLFMAEGGVAAVGGSIDVFGTTGGEEVTLLHGEIVLDASFNRGNDRIMLDGGIGDFEVRLTGSTVRFHGSELDLTIPVGTSGTLVGFRGGVEHTLAYDTEKGAVMLGHLAIGREPVALGAIA